MTKYMIDCGNCRPDFMAIRTMVASHFDVQVLKADSAAEVIECMKTHTISLITVNRKLDVDYSDGIDAITQIKADKSVTQVPIMLITNYEEYMQAAITLGCVPGFGKKDIHTPKTIEILRKYLQ